MWPNRTKAIPNAVKEILTESVKPISKEEMLSIEVPGRLPNKDKEIAIRKYHEHLTGGDVRKL